MNARAKKLDAEQGDKGVPFDKPGKASLPKDQLTSSDEKRNEDVQASTSSVPRSQQRSNASRSSDRVASSAGEQGDAVLSSLNQYEVVVLYHPDLEMDL